MENQTENTNVTSENHDTIFDTNKMHSQNQ